MVKYWIFSPWDKGQDTINQQRTKNFSYYYQAKNEFGEGKKKEAPDLKGWSQPIFIHRQQDQL